MPQPMQTTSLTIPLAFVESMLLGARRLLAPQAVDTLIREAGISPALVEQQAARVTREQFVRLYERISVTTGDEMLGLWSRPIRAGTLKYLGLSLLDAPTLLVALYRFTRFWNLLLDDYRLDLADRLGAHRVWPRADGQAHARGGVLAGGAAFAD